MDSDGVPSHALQRIALVVHVLLAYNQSMKVSLSPDVEAKLNRIASQAGKGPEQIVGELVANYLDHDEWFRQEVEKGLASLDEGKFASHEEVRRQIDRILGS